MTKFFYVFLLDLLLFCERHHVDARLLDTRTLDKSHFEIDHSEWSELPKSYGRSLEPATDAREINPDANFKGPFGCFQYQRVNPKLSKNVGLNVNLKRKMLQNEEGKASKWQDILKDSLGMKKWRNRLERARKKRFLPDHQFAFPSDTPEKYVDYTNSQMPFNEGQRLPQKKSETSEATWHGSKGFHPDYYSVPIAVPHRLGRSMRRRFEEKNFEMLRDDSILEYSRVRRFLDQERAKKQTRVSSTLEAKEAAMSEVLDPNLNSDGILEPHVRKRRGNAPEQDLSFEPRHLEELRSKSDKPTNNKSAGKPQ